MLVIPGILFHEFIHWITLKILGYKGKLVFIPKHLAPGIKPIGLKENIICARDAIPFTLAPLPFTIIWFIICFQLMSIGESIIIPVSLGLLTGVCGCLMDIKQSIEIWIWWIKPERKRRNMRYTNRLEVLLCHY